MMSLEQMLLGLKLKFPLCSGDFRTRGLLLPMFILRIACKLGFNDLTTTQRAANIRILQQTAFSFANTIEFYSPSQSKQFRLKKFCFSTLKANLNNFSSFPGERLCDVLKSVLRLAQDKASEAFRKDENAI